MKIRNPLWILMFYLILGIGLLILLTTGNYRFSQENPGGNDFLVHWVGARAYIEDGLSPYSDEVALRIQEIAYGRPAQEGEHELRIAYPLYSILIFLPFALIKEYVLARAIWMTLLEAGIIIFAFITLRLSTWRPKPIMLVFFLLFSVFWYHSLRPIILGNVVILVAFGLALSVYAIRNGNYELAGVILAFTTIKPQVVLIPVVFLLLWGIFNKKWKIIFWFGATLFLLIGFSSLLIPDWILQNLREVLRYPEYNPPGNISSALAALMPASGKRVGLAISIIIGLVLVIEWIISIRSEFYGFYWTFCLTLVVSLWIGLQTDPGNFIVAFPAIPLIFSTLIRRWKTTGQWISYLLMVILGVGIWVIFITTIDYLYQPIQNPIMFLPLPLILLFLLYWIRWWAIGMPKLWLQH